MPFDNLPSLSIRTMKTCLAYMVLLFIVFSSITPFVHVFTPSAIASSSIKGLEQKRKSNLQKLQKIKQLKRQILLKEKYVTSNILQNQRRLDASQSSLTSQKQQLNLTKNGLLRLSDALENAMADQQVLSQQVAKRLRSLYMGERLSFLHMLLDSGQLSSMMDRLYYKKKIVAQDKTLYRAFLQKTRILEDRKNDLARQKQHLAQTINRIQTYQEQLNESVELDKVLVQKLRTSRQAYEMAEDQLERESSSIERQIIAATRHGGVVLGSTGRLMSPVSARLTSGFGYRYHPIFHTTRFHSGIDFGAGYGTPIRAADGGTILLSGWQGGYGKVVIINHGSKGGPNISTLYGHMSATSVRSGQAVSKGQVIGYVGSTGYSTGAHLHFEVRENGRPVNPLGYLR